MKNALINTTLPAPLWKMSCRQGLLALECRQADPQQALCCLYDLQAGGMRWEGIPLPWWSSLLGMDEAGVWISEYAQGDHLPEVLQYSCLSAAKGTMQLQASLPQLPPSEGTWPLCYQPDSPHHASISSFLQRQGIAPKPEACYWYLERPGGFALAYPLSEGWQLLVFSLQGEVLLHTPLSQVQDDCPFLWHGGWLLFLSAPEVLSRFAL